MIIEKGNAFICQVNHRYKYIDSGTLCPTYWVHFIPVPLLPHDIK